LDLGIAGKSAVVTGGSGGLGSGIAEALAREGVNLCLVARDKSALARITADLEDRYGVHVHACSADMADAAEVERVAGVCVAKLGSVDILVNCAGATKRGDFFGLSEQDWQNGYALKFFSAVRLSRALWPELRKNRGSVVNIVGLGSRMPEGDFTIGGSVNAALLNFTKALSQIGIADGVRVNAINPGFFKTGRLMNSLRAKAEGTGLPLAEMGESLLHELGIDRFGNPEEVGSLVAFMVSGQSQYLNGAAVELDGGSRRPI
jgi:3-oxoacyl-[acyl-carrier protein] reductase